MNQLRILLISHTYFPSGYRGKLRLLAERPDIELHLAGLKEMKTSTGRFHYEISDADRYPQYWLNSVFQSHNVLRIYALLPLARLLRQIRPHIVHIEAEPHAVALTQTLALRALSRYRTLFFTWENIFRARYLPLRWVEHFNLRFSDAAIAGNAAAVEVLRQRGFRRTIYVIPQVGVDVDYSQRAIPSIRWAALKLLGPVVGFVGRLVSEKGVADLLEAFAQMSEQPCAQLLLIGDGALRRILEARAMQLGIGDRVHFAGNVPFGEIPACLKCMNVMVLPSRTTAKWKEQFGRVLAEAMAVGVPVIGSSSGAIPEVLGGAGLIFPEGDICALRSKLATLLQDSALAATLVQGGIQRANENFTNEIIADKTYQVYRELCP